MIGGSTGVAISVLGIEAISPVGVDDSIHGHRPKTTRCRKSKIQPGYEDIKKSPFPFQSEQLYCIEAFLI